METQCQCGSYEHKRITHNDCPLKRVKIENPSRLLIPLVRKTSDLHSTKSPDNRDTLTKSPFKVINLLFIIFIYYITFSFFIDLFKEYRWNFKWVSFR